MLLLIFAKHILFIVIHNVFKLSLHVQTLFYFTMVGIILPRIVVSMPVFIWHVCMHYVHFTTLNSIGYLSIKLTKRINVILKLLFYYCAISKFQLFAANVILFHWSILNIIGPWYRTSGREVLKRFRTRHAQVLDEEYQIEAPEVTINWWNTASK